MFSNVDILGKFIPSMVWNSCILLNYIFKFIIKLTFALGNINIADILSKGSFKIFLTVSNDELSPILDKFLTDGYVNY